MQTWLNRREEKACPVCRVIIKTSALQRFAVGQKEPPPRIVNDEPVPKFTRKIDYSVIHRTVFESIQMMESLGSYGSKIETLVKHLLYCQAIETGAKSIVFSAWADSLNSKSVT